MNEKLLHDAYDDTETDFSSPDYALNIEALRTHYNEQHIGSQALKGVVEIGPEE